MESTVDGRAFDARVISNIGVLAAILESGNFARAARSLGLSRSGVSRAVSRLEAQVGVRLLDRTTRALALTDEGRRLYSDVLPLLSRIEDAVRVVSGSALAVRGRLRVNVDAFFSSLLLAPRLAEFLELYPELSLELVAKDQLGDLVADGFDLAVRFGKPADSSLVAKKLLETRTITVAAPAYLARHGRPAVPAELANHVCIKVRDSLTGRPIDEWQFFHGQRFVPVRISGRLMVAEFGTLLGACVAGVGIARVKAVGVERLIRDGALLEVLSGFRGEPHTLYALYPSRHLAPAKVRAFIDFVQSRSLRKQPKLGALLSDRAPKAGARRRRSDAAQR